MESYSTPAFDPTRALTKVVLQNSYDRTDYLTAMFNPEQLSVTVNVNTGSLHSIGASHGVEQYASTSSPEFPLEFYFSSGRAAQRSDTQPAHIMDAIKWLTANCYAREAGRAPDPLLVIWPNVLSMVYAVKSIVTTYSRFSRTLGVKSATVALTGVELCRDFHTFNAQRIDGFEHESYEIEQPSTGYELSLGRK